MKRNTPAVSYNFRSNFYKFRKQTPALDNDALERATEQMEKKLQQVLEQIERVTKKLGSTTARLHRLGWAL